MRFSHSRLLPLAGALALTLWVVRPLVAQLPAIQLHALSTSVFHPGGEFDVSVSKGTYTDEVTELVFSHPGIKAELKQNPPKPFADGPTPNFGNFVVRIPPDVPRGRYEVRAVGRFGISNPRSILVVAKSERHAPAGNTIDAATPIVSGQLHHSKCRPQKIDFYSVDVESGVPIIVQVLTHALDSRAIAEVAVADRYGSTLYSCIGNDTNEIWFPFEPQESGALVIAVHDALFRGGEDFGYAISVTPADQAPRPDTSAKSLFDVRHPRETGVAPATTEPVNEQDPILLTSLPASLVGSFNSPRDQDAFVCDFEKGKELLIEVVSDRIGQPTDTRIVVERKTGEQDGQATWQRVAVGDDSPNTGDQVINLASKDPVVRFTPPETGTYRVAILDQDAGTPAHRPQLYELSIKPSESDWNLIAYHLYPNKDLNTSRPTGVYLPKGTSTTLRVFGVRNGYNGPIEVSVADLPTGLSCQRVVIPAGKNSADLILTATDEVTTLHTRLRVVGTIRQGETTEAKDAQFATVTWEKDGQLPLIQTRLVNDLFVSASDRDECPIKIIAEPPADWSTDKGQKIKLPIKVIRNDNSKQNVVLRARNLPPGVKAGDLTIKGDATEAEWTIDVAGNAAAGVHSFWAQAETKVKFRVNPQAHDRIVAYRDKLNAIKADASRAAEHPEVDKALAETEKQVEAIKKATDPRDFTVYLPIELITLKIN